MQNKKPTIAVSTLGCPKNLVDTENMIGILHSAGYEISSDHEKADISLVNTCTFIEGSTHESVDTLAELATAGKKLIITGCLAQRYKSNLFDELPEAQAVLGTGNIMDVLSVVEEVSSNLSKGLDSKIVKVDEKPSSIASSSVPRINTQLGSSAYIKISEGCDHRCAFCIIPSLRGDLKSRPIEDILKEAQGLVQQGVKEIILVSQDSTAYGTDLYKRRALADLLRTLADESGAKWIRVMYAYPTEMDEEMLDVIADKDNILKYIDIPLQHASSKILRAMKRPDTVRDTVELIRKKIPQATIRTTFIVGFPAETDEDFQELYKFIDETRFDRVGVFTYSPEEGTPAADLPEQVSEKIKEKRRDKLMILQQKISLELNRAYIGRQLTMLVEHIEEQVDPKGKVLVQRAIGRSHRDAPEIDGQLIMDLKPDEIAPCPGEFIEVLVTACDEYDLKVRPIEP